MMRCDQVHKRLLTCRSLVASVAAVLLTGCATDSDLYDQYYTGTGSFQSNTSVISDAFLKAYLCLRDWIVLVIILSELCGWFLLTAFSKRNKKIKKQAIFGFMIGLPAGMLLIFFGMAFYLNNLYYP